MHKINRHKAKGVSPHVVVVGGTRVIMTANFITNIINATAALRSQGPIMAACRFNLSFIMTPFLFSKGSP